MFSRLGTRDVHGGGTQIFSEQMRPGEDVVQLCGEENCGKTELLFNVIADAILPDQWNNIKLPGRNLSTIFISADYKFDILRLVCVMENKLKEALQKQNPKFKKSLPSILVQKSIVTSSLERCHVFKTSSGDELLSTIEWMPKFLQRNLDVSIIAIDNVAAYYWMERSKYGLAEYESRQKCLVNGLKKLKEGYRIVILYTVPSLMSSSKVNTIDIIATHLANTIIITTYEESLTTLGFGIFRLTVS